MVATNIQDKIWLAYNNFNRDGSILYGNLVEREVHEIYFSSQTSNDIKSLIMNDQIAFSDDKIELLHYQSRYSTTTKNLQITNDRDKKLEIAFKYLEGKIQTIGILNNITLQDYTDTNQNDCLVCLLLSAIDNPEWSFVFEQGDTNNNTNKNNFVHILDFAKESRYHDFTLNKLFYFDHAYYFPEDPHHDDNLYSREEIIEILYNGKYIEDVHLPDNITKDDLLKVDPEIFIDICNINDMIVYTFQKYVGKYKCYDNTYVTENGENIVAFGYYGYKDN